MNQASIDLAAATRRREDGIARSQRAAGADWSERALAFVREYLRTHATLFVDDLWSAGLEEPTSPRALGAVMLTAQRRGWMAEYRHGEWIYARPSVRSNGQLKRVWRSHLYAGPRR